MTENDQQREMGSVAKELADLRHNCACLQARIDRFMAMLARASTQMQHVKDAVPKASRNYQPTIDMSNWPTYSDIGDAMRELDQGRDRIAELQARLRKLNVID